jgi:large subunit ribosomal protein L15
MAEMYKIKKPAMKRRKRVGRGGGSGHGKTSCRGQKGQLSRSGSKHRPWFEGGQMPLQRRVPKRGFTNKFRIVAQIVNIADISRIGASEVDPKFLFEKGLIKKADIQVKILGNGDISKPVTVTADAFSDSAKEKIEKAGGKVLFRSN